MEVRTVWVQSVDELDEKHGRSSTTATLPPYTKKEQLWRLEARGG